MDEQFLEAIKTYFNIVKNECDSLISYIENVENIKILNKYDLFSYFNQTNKKEFVIEEKKYSLHGIGMMVTCEDVVIANWNFGCKSWWNGIDPFFMAETLKNSCFMHTDYYNSNYIKEKCEKYVIENFLYYYKGQYYVDMLKLGCIKTNFPKVYDEVVIEYKGIKKVYPRSKIFERFIRKSNYVYAKISELDNNYILIFFDNNIEVAKIPYNDIAYPESAVEIMNSEIIRPHVVELWK